MGTSTQSTARRFERIHVRMPVTLRVGTVRQGMDHPASAADLSKCGLRIYASVGLLPGQVVSIIVDAERGCTIPGRVAWVGPIGSRLEGQAGIEFLRPIPVEV